MSRYQKGKTNLDSLKQETVSGSGINWAICKSACRSRQITMPAPHHSVFYRPGALPAAQPTASKQWTKYFSIHLTTNFLTNLPLKICLNRFRFEIIMLIGMWSHFFDPPCMWRQNQLAFSNKKTTTTK